MGRWAAIAAAALALGGSLGPAAAQGTVPARAFEVPAGPLDATLLAFARAAGLRLAADAGVLSGRRSEGVDGRLPPRAALDRVLAGTGLAGRIERGTVLVATPLELPALRVDAEAPPVRLAQAGGALALPQIDVNAQRPTPSTGVIGSLPPPLPGGQVASGGRAGFLGNRNIRDAPFSQTSYTEQFIRDQQAQTIYDVAQSDPAVRTTVPRFATQENLLVRGFVVNSRDYAFDGYFGLTDPRRSAIEGVERLEILTGPGSLLFGQAPLGAVGGVVNLIPKRAGSAPLNRFTTLYQSNGTLGGAFDVGRRFGKDDAVGVRLNGAFTGGEVPVNGQGNQVGVFTAGLDWRGDRARISGDFGYQYLDYDRVQNSYNVLSGFAVPKAPHADLNQSPRWETGRSDQIFGLLRGEYDVADNITAYGAFGGAQHTERFLLANPTIINNRGDLRFQGSLNDGEFENVKIGEVGVRGQFDIGPVRNAPSLSLNGYWQESGFAGANVGAPYLSNLYAPFFAPKPSLAGVVTNPPRTNTTSLTSVAFGDTASILDDRVQLLAGVRAQKVATRGYNLSGARTAAYDSSAVSPLVGLVVQPWRPLSLYVNYAEGLSAGQTAPVTAVNAGAVFPPFVSKQVEIGAKVEVGTVGVTLAAFEITRPSAFLNPSTNVFTVSGEQRNRGIELRTFGAIRPDLRVLGGITFLDGVLTSTAGGTFNGKQAPGVARTQMNAGAEYDLPFVPGLTTSARVIYTSPQFVDQGNTQRIPEWATLDLGLRYQFELERKPVFARFNILNVTGNNYWASASQGLSTGTPRTFLLSLSSDL